MAHVAIAIKNRIFFFSFFEFFKWQRRRHFCRMSRRPNHVIIQDVLQGTCISFIWLQQQLSAQNQTTLDPTARLPLKNSAWAICYKYLTHREKANLDSQEVHDITHFVSATCIPWFMSTQDLLFSLESVNLYYFNIIKKYTSHMYNLTKKKSK